MKTTNILLLGILVVLGCFLGALLVYVRLLPIEQRAAIVALFAPTPKPSPYSKAEDLLFYCSQQLMPEPAGPRRSYDKGELSLYALLSYGGCIPTLFKVIQQSRDVLCIAPAPEGKLTIERVVTYLQQHPERMHERAETLVLAALQESDPCHAKP